MDENGQIIELVYTPPSRIVKADQLSFAVHWPWLRERLLDIKASNEFPVLPERRKIDRRALAVSMGQSGRCRWTPEQVRWAILKGFHGGTTAELFWVIGSDEVGEHWQDYHHEVIKGFFITLTNIDPIAGVPLDFILWLVWAGYPHLLEELAPEFRRLGLERGCTAAEHSSSRPGWVRRQRGCGAWKLKYFTWRWEF